MADAPTTDGPIYDGDTASLLNAEDFGQRVSLLPGDSTPLEPDQRIRILWGQDMLRDVLDGRYRAVICGVNEHDNSHGIIAQLVDLVRTSQWTVRSVTSYAKIFQASVKDHAGHDQEPYILKYDLDSILVLGMLRPSGRDHFTLEDLERGFATITKMLSGRVDRRPVATVSFLGARSNRLVGPGGAEPSFETVLRTMHGAGYRGDAYPSPKLWDHGSIGAFPSYPFPAGLERMRAGSS